MSLRALVVPVARRHVAQVHEMRVGSLPDFSEPVGEQRPSHPGPGRPGQGVAQRRDVARRLLIQSRSTARRRRRKWPPGRPDCAGPAAGHETTPTPRLSVPRPARRSSRTGTRPRPTGSARHRSRSRRIPRPRGWCWRAGAGRDPRAAGASHRRRPQPATPRSRARRRRRAATLFIVPGSTVPIRTEDSAALHVARRRIDPRPGDESSASRSAGSRNGSGCRASGPATRIASWIAASSGARPVQAMGCGALSPSASRTRSTSPASLAEASHSCSRPRRRDR